MREKTIEQKLREEVVTAGGLALKFTSPSMTGVPDRIILLPGGRVIFVELKAPDEDLSPRQKKVKKLFGSLGMDVRVIDSMEKVRLFTDEIRTL